MPTQEDLSRALHPHIFNEIDQLARMLVVQPCDRVWANARVESIAVHVRCLLDFFKQPAEKPEKDDVFAVDYRFTGPGIDRDKVRVLRQRCNKDISHLTYSRIARYESGESGWDPRELAALLELCEQFVRHIGKDRTHQDGAHEAEWHDLACRLQCLLRCLA